MPLGGRRLSAGDIETIRRWIDEGARGDGSSPPRYVRSAPAKLPPGRTLIVSCRPRGSVYLTLTILDRRDGHPLLERVATVKSPKEEADAGEPGDRISWEIRAEPGWLADIEVRLAADYAAADPGEMEFAVRLADP